MSVSLKIPAYLSNFSSLDNGRTIADLKVFYIGETQDGRLFDKDFAEKIVKTLPYCPVVTFYDKDKKDFIGHNDYQNIYGIVREDADTRFEKENDVTWLKTQVMLYTDRSDNIGTIANKIVGHPHSLELDPKTVKYEVFKENGRTKIKFTEGSLIGLSVLGTKQKPAFTGSEFFMATDFSIVRERFETFFSYLEEESRGGRMDKEKFVELANFVQLSYDEKRRLVYSKLADIYEPTLYCYYIDSFFDNYCVVDVFDIEQCREYYQKVNYSIENETVTLGENFDCYKRFLTKEELESLDNLGNAKDNEEQSNYSDSSETGKEQKEENCSEQEDPKEDLKDESKGNENLENKDEDPKDEDPKDEPEDKEDGKEVKDKDEKDNYESTATENTNCEEQKPQQEQHTVYTSTLSDSEREELETYRRQSKLSLIESFKDLLDNTILDEFSKKVDEYDYAKLESELAIKFSRSSKQKKQVQTSTPFSFSNLVDNSTNKTEESYAELVARTLKKN